MSTVDAAGVVLLVAIVTNGLLAGLFFFCACAVVPGFRRVDARTAVAAFRAINRAIVGGWFLLVFFLAPVSTVTAAVLVPSPVSAAGAVCAVLTFLVTVVGNVPLNTALERADVGAEADLRRAWAAFARPWASLNLTRTLTALAALALCAASAVVH